MLFVKRRTQALCYCEILIPERKHYVAREITDDDVITPAQGRAVAKEMGAFYYETSVLVQYGIDEVGVLVQYGSDEICARSVRQG